MHARPPFDATAARRLREALGMTPAHVAYGMFAAYGVRVSPTTVAAWEQQEEAPGEDEIAALAGALWCAPSDLLGTPRTLREHRMAAGVPLADVAIKVGIPVAQYEEVERTGRWTGNDRQAAVLADLLRLPPRTHLELTGRDARLREMLRSAASVRWQAYVRPVCKLLPAVPQPNVERVLERLNDEFHKRSFASLSWIDTSSEAANGSVDAGHRYLADVVEHFWELLEAL
ncbi:helix-turn-helix transcriptional regulator [Streptomyces sp. OF3]|uniref:Helix-turn-helix domain-containing protein n=2 Tax=Streptomyces alkaliterrae TaxID=2213162 RepID=A0A5P0YPS3_9ACTN|nr:helix-turn-helix transcriptional regulator [Streptomyces alkaliterrae]MBB1261284.1 helix-turn-helix transcriptional regulator [Streptomyces alkaliterrae]MQS02316.1 helix-turn-helix domain-containing protein [Streptomyces alkaliterrae]